MYDAGVLRLYKLVRTLPRTRSRYSDDAAATRYTRDLFNRWVGQSPMVGPKPDFDRGTDLERVLQKVLLI